MCAQGTRRSDRVNLSISIEVLGTDAHGQQFHDQARTVVASRHGGVIFLKRELGAEQEVLIRRRAAGNGDAESPARVVGEWGEHADGHAYCVAFPDPQVNLWGIEFPYLPGAEAALARTLVECNRCGNREVAHLRELELRDFEASRLLARVCKNCGAPTIWSLALQEDAIWPLPHAAETIEPSPDEATESAKQDPAKTRIKTRLTGCVRLPAREEEIVVTENISRTGLCFRSRTRYAEGTRVEVAAIYARGAVNIFVPARIIYTQELRAAGLFRHGVAYLSPPNGQTNS